MVEVMTFTNYQNRQTNKTHSDEKFKRTKRIFKLNPQH